LKLIKQLQRLFTKPSIGRRFAMAILAFSSIVTLASTAMQLSIEYEKDVSEINSQLNQIRDGYSQSLASSLWVTSEKDLKLQLDGIIKLPDMQYLEVLSDDGEVLATAGVKQSGQVISQHYPLNYTHRGNELRLGQLNIVATLDGVYARLKSKVLVILATQGVKTFLVSLFILYLFQQLVGRHLTTVANFTSLANGANLQSKLDLKRPANKSSSGDELDQVVHALNEMRLRLQIYYQELQESEFRWKFALEGRGDGVWDWDLISNKASYSDMYKAILGYDKEVVWNDLSEWKNRCNPEHFAHAMSDLQRYFNHETASFSTEIQMQHKEGHWIWVLARGMISASDETGRPLRIIGTISDISAQKATEEREKQLNRQLAQATKMESIGHLTGGIAHDFNNILGAIMGYAELSQNIMTTKPDVYGNLPRYMAEILAGSERAKQLIQQMLVFSRLSPDMQDSPQVVVMLQPLIKEVVSLLRSSIPATITLDYKILQDNLKARIQPVQLHQIIMNLGINARDAIGGKGAINFSLGIYHGEQHACSSCNNAIQGTFVDIAVRDTGPGVPDTLLHSIFDPFFTTKGIGKGTGMGLSVVHGIVHQADGHIIVESVIDVGTTFHILLPVVVADETEISKSGDSLPPTQNLSGLKIMVVDDEQGMTAMLQDTLEAQGASVSAYNEPLAALEAFRTNTIQFDLVITDETMPNLSGMHLAQKLLGLRADLPIILCTGFSDYATAEEVAKIGIAGFMYKPLETPLLLKQVADLTHKQ
jgi:PAS domain S-box-containing protein